MAVVRPKKTGDRQRRVVHFRCGDPLIEALQAGAEKSGWSIHEQARFELEMLHKVAHPTPYVPETLRKVAAG